MHDAVVHLPSPHTMTGLSVRIYELKRFIWLGHGGGYDDDVDGINSKSTE